MCASWQSRRPETAAYGVAALVFGCLLLPLVLSACSSSRLRLGEAAIAKQAKEEVMRREGVEEKTLEVQSVNHTNSQWEILIWRLPKTPGGTRLVTLSEKGQILGYVRGK